MNVYGEGKPAYQTQKYRIEGETCLYEFKTLDDAKKYFGKGYTVTNLEKPETNRPMSNSEIRRNLGWDLIKHG